ncbi:DUF6777 domain-containing protein [Streptomyces sp. NPDC014995]|uniref:DUF6777 domain-containing protein n=1 Tax=Streptomyces sp. NPDC014995 TaxID=3364936 RepID=UPI0037031346
MSVEPPSSGRPTGPPSGPLSGRSRPPSGPPSQPPGGTSGGTPTGGTPEPRGPWWKSVQRVALLTTALVIAVALALVLTRTDGGGGGGAGGDGRDGEVFLQAAGKTGPDPFTDNTATTPSVPPTTSAPPTTSEPANVVRGVDGDAGGLYGGTRNATACDVEKQIRFLQEAPAKNGAFASVAGIEPSQVPAYLRSLTPVQLRMDTRVTNHGYRDGAATPYQAVLQSGTAVLVDARGVPRVRCACGNPLTPPVAQRTQPKLVGDSWPSYRPSNVVVVTPSRTVVEVFVLYDPRHERWFARPRGDTGEKDRPAKPPAKPPLPSASVSLPSSPSDSPSPSRPSSPSSPSSPSRPSSPPSPPSSPPSPSASPSPPTSPGSPPPERESPADSPSPPPPPPPLTSRPEREEPPSPPQAPTSEEDTTTQSAPASEFPESPGGSPAV